MSNFLLYTIFYIIFCVRLRFFLNYSHLLNRLLRLELLSVSVFLFIGLNINILGIDLFYLLYFLVILVCEGVLGLSLLIVNCYNYGRDYVRRFNRLVC